MPYTTHSHCTVWPYAYSAAPVRPYPYSTALVLCGPSPIPQALGPYGAHGLPREPQGGPGLYGALGGPGGRGNTPKTAHASKRLV